ncbi:hypothetical protein H0E87_003904 [Populus deltoides]|uniref:Peptidase C1A papain C-terminal domain-containing protein n=1 Tax=Populus deltoides TaxID=3696 RepID=A0A8T2ZD21_POPDE|nr:hypothetical protein H0E87_003904 [Populus deltoides]
MQLVLVYFRTASRFGNCISYFRTQFFLILSEQELVDCDRSFNGGCEAGLMDYAFQFVVNNHGIDTELKRHVVTIDKYVDVPQNNEKQLLQAVAAQPVSVGICGSERAFQMYSKGIFTGACLTSLDHAVLIVGYGSENGVDPWSRSFCIALLSSI